MPFLKGGESLRSRDYRAGSGRASRQGSLHAAKKKGVGPLVKLAISVAVAAAVLLPGYRYLRTLSGELARLKEEVVCLEQKNRELKRKIEQMENDAFYVEKLAREMGLVKEGEVVYRIKEEPGDNGESGSEQVKGE